MTPPVSDADGCIWWLGFVEAGHGDPKRAAGNPKPRLFRLDKELRRLIKPNWGLPLKRRVCFSVRRSLAVTLRAATKKEKWESHAPGKHRRKSGAHKSRQEPATRNNNQKWDVGAAELCGRDRDGGGALKSRKLGLVLHMRHIAPTLPGLAPYSDLNPRAPARSLLSENPADAGHPPGREGRDMPPRRTTETQDHQTRAQRDTSRARNLHEQ